MSEQNPKPRIYTENNPTVTRILPELAATIGLNESIVLMQLDYLIGISEHYKDGQWWTYQSLRELKTNYFPYWSIQTIDRAIKNLEKKELILVANYNKHEYDKTRWFAINPKSVNELEGVVISFISVPQTKVSQNGTTRSNMEQGVSQNETGVSQNGTTIPETTTKITEPETTQRKEEEGTPQLEPEIEATITPDSSSSKETISQFHEKFCEILGLFWNETNKRATQKHAYPLFDDGYRIKDLVYVRRYCDDGHYPKDIKKHQVKYAIGEARTHYELLEPTANDSQYGTAKGDYSELMAFREQLKAGAV